VRAAEGDPAQPYGTDFSHGLQAVGPLRTKFFLDFWFEQRSVGGTNEPNDALCDLILNREHVGRRKVPIIGLCPQLPAVLCVEQLRSDAEVV
jgi:hypothetical protein